jgi:hypothetical protein
MSFSTSALLIRPSNHLPPEVLFDVCGISTAAQPVAATVRHHFSAERGIAAIACFPLGTAVFCYGRLNALLNVPLDEPIARTLAVHSKTGEIAYVMCAGVVGAYWVMLWRDGVSVRGLGGTSLAAKPHFLTGQEQEFERTVLQNLVRDYGGSIGDWRAVRDGEVREIGGSIHKHSGFGEAYVFECFRMMTGYSPDDCTEYEEGRHPLWDTAALVYKAAASPTAAVPE